MAQFQYKTEVVGTKGLKGADGLAEAIDEMTNRYGHHGWKLVSVAPLMLAGSSARVLVTFEQEVPAQSS